jgi:leader peptidase (prepilin peptidase)/N-methyltransferase
LISAVALGIYLFFTIPICYYDLRYRRIPDHLSYPALLLLGLYQLLVGDSLFSALILAAGGVFGILWLTRRLSKGGLGWGDLKLGALNGLLLPSWLWLPGLAVGCVAAILFYLPLYTTARIERNYRIPFAPFLTGGAVLMKLLQLGEVI